MKKKWTISGQLKRNFLIDLFFMPIFSLISLIMGIVFCSKTLWLGILFICLGVVLAIGTVLGIRWYLKEKEEEEAEKAKIEYLEKELIRMKTEQEKISPKTIDVNDRDDVI